MNTTTTYLALAVTTVLFGYGAVAHAADTTVCTADYAPVCASHQVQCIKAPCYPVYQTYTNACQMQRDGSSLIHMGTCSLDESGPIKPAPAPYVPPKNCTAWFDGCNSCSKQSNGTAVCTMRACSEVSTTAGRCTAYATPPASSGGSSGTVHSGTGTSVKSPEPVATSTATTTPEQAIGFWHRVWAWLTGWFH